MIINQIYYRLKTNNINDWKEKFPRLVRQANPLDKKNEHIGNRTQVLGPEIPCTTTMLYALTANQQIRKFLLYF